VCGPAASSRRTAVTASLSNGEACDEGATNGTGYGHCTTSCTLGPRCGDSLLQAGNASSGRRREQRSTADKCTSTCKLKCGTAPSNPASSATTARRATRAVTASATRTARSAASAATASRTAPSSATTGRTTAATAHAIRTAPSPDIAETRPCRILRDLRPGCDEQLVGIRPDGVHEPLHARPYCRKQAGRRSVRRAVRRRRQQRPRRVVREGLQVLHPADELRKRHDRRARTVRRRYEQRHRQQQVRHHCRLKCGNGLRDTGEQCDDGVNTGATARATPTARSRPTARRIKNGLESCDNGRRTSRWPPRTVRHLHDGVHVRALLRRPPRRGAVLARRATVRSLATGAARSPYRTDLSGGGARRSASRRGPQRDMLRSMGRRSLAVLLLALTFAPACAAAPPPGPAARRRT